MDSVPSLYLVLYDAHLDRRHDGRVDEPEEHDGADGADVGLLARREALAQDLVQAVAHRPKRGGRKDPRAFN